MHIFRGKWGKLPQKQTKGMDPWVVLYNPGDIVYQEITGRPSAGPRRRNVYHRILKAAFTFAQIYFWLKG